MTYGCGYEAQNFFKHANADPNAALSFETQYTEVLLIDAVQKYARLIGECPRIMTVYFVWFVAQHPFMLDQVAMPDSLHENIKLFRGAAPIDRRTFYAEYCPIVKSLAL